MARAVVLGRVGPSSIRPALSSALCRPRLLLRMPLPPLPLPLLIEPEQPFPPPPAPLLPPPPLLPLPLKLSPVLPRRCLVQTRPPRLLPVPLPLGVPPPPLRHSRRCTFLRLSRRRLPAQMP